MEQNNKENGGPTGNIGALFTKVGRKNDYFLIKVTVRNENCVFVAFPNPKKDFNNPDSLYSKEPTYFIFPYKPKPKDGNNGNIKD